MRNKYIILGLKIVLCLTILRSTELHAQEYSVREILITHIDMDVDFPFSIDSAMFESLDNDSIRISDIGKLSLFQHGLDELVPADSMYSNIDIRRKITLIYSDGNKEILYADYFHICYRGKIYLYQGVIRYIIEKTIRPSYTEKVDSSCIIKVKGEQRDEN